MTAADQFSRILIIYDRVFFGDIQGKSLPVRLWQGDRGRCIVTSGWAGVGGDRRDDRTE